LSIEVHWMEFSGAPPAGDHVMVVVLIWLLAFESTVPSRPAACP